MKKINCIIYQDGDQFVVLCLNTGVASQGDTYEEAIHNIKEAVELYLEDETDATFTPISAVTLTEQYINA
ncbi:MAG: type II toxin-antitoxin system HicB family antitoxin [Rickettsiales bacterium]|nr:type II toxin-antitoxin system HicB family antitoxin [Rickettsiales bacterium]